MLPETDFALMRGMMFLSFSKNYYIASNSADSAGAYIDFEGLLFPVHSGCSLTQLESKYIKKNKQIIDKRKVELEKQILNDMASTNGSLSIEKDKQFFLKICKMSGEKFDRIIEREANLAYQPSGNIELSGAFCRALPFDFAAINDRIFPLFESKGQDIVSFNGRNYGLGASIKGLGTINEIDLHLRNSLEKEIADYISRTSEEVGAITLEILRFKKSNEDLAAQMGIIIGDFTYDYNDRVLDWQNRVIGCSIHEHYNSNMGKSYKHGESAIVLPFSNGQLSTSIRFAERPNAKGPFIISGASCCLGGLSPSNETIGAKLQFLESYAMMVGDQGTYYVAPGGGYNNEEQY